MYERCDQIRQLFAGNFINLERISKSWIHRIRGRCRNCRYTILTKHKNWDVRETDFEINEDKLEVRGLRAGSPLVEALSNTRGFAQSFVNAAMNGSTRINSREDYFRKRTSAEF